VAFDGENGCRKKACKRWQSDDVHRQTKTRNRTVIEKIVEGDLDLVFDHVTSAFGG